jgi:hypothetical protein
MGGVVRNSAGSVTCSMAALLPNCNDAEEAEAGALLTGLQCCCDLNLQPAVVESDCAGVVSAVKAEEEDFSRLCFIYREIHRRRREDFNFEVALVKRDCSSVAHELARLARVEGIVGIW